MWYYNGTSWAEQTPAGATDQNWYCGDIDGTRMVAGVYGGRLWYFDGSSWSEQQPVGNANYNWQYASISGTKMAVSGSTGATTKRAYYYDGSSWAETQPNGNVDKLWSIAISGSKMIAGARSGRLYYHNGTSWAETQPAGVADKNWRIADISGDNMLAGADGGRLYFYNGSSWAETQPAGNVNKTWFDGALSGTRIIAIPTAGANELYYYNGSSWSTETVATDDFYSTGISDEAMVTGAINSGRLYTNIPSVMPTSNWSDTDNWSTTSGGTTGAAEPTASDDVFFDASSAVTSVTTTAGAICASLTATVGSAWSITGTDTLTVQGAVTLESDLTISAPIEFSGAVVASLDFAGATISNDVTISTGEYTFASNLTVTGGHINMTGGLIDAVTYNITTDETLHLSVAGALPSSGIYFGTGTWQASVITAFPSSADYETSTIKVVNDTGSATTLDMSGIANTSPSGFYNLWLTGTGAGGFNITRTTDIYITGDWKIDGVSKPINFGAGYADTGFYINTFTCTGTALITYTLTGNGSDWGIYKSSGTVTCDYLDLSDSNASGGATFDAGANSIDSGNNTGWTIGGATTTYDEKQTIMFGSATSTSERDAYLYGATRVGSEVDVTIEGSHDLVTSEREAMLVGIVALTEERGVRIEGIPSNWDYTEKPVASWLKSVKPAVTWQSVVKTMAEWAGIAKTSAIYTKLIKNATSWDVPQRPETSYNIETKSSTIFTKQPSNTTVWTRQLL